LNVIICLAEIGFAAAVPDLGAQCAKESFGTFDALNARRLGSLWRSAVALSPFESTGQ